MNKQTPRRILRWPEVEARFNLSRVTIWRMENAGTFPRRVELGPNSVGWFEDELEAYANKLAAARTDAQSQSEPRRKLVVRQKAKTAA